MEPSHPPGDRAASAPPLAAGGSGNAPASGRPHRPTEINALLGRGTRFEGKLFFDGRVRIDGTFRGEIEGDDVLVIGEGARVVGTIEVATCIVTGGEVQADIRARDAIELYAPAQVKGALHAPAIFIDRGVVFEGSCKMAPLDQLAGPAEPSVEAGPAERPAPAGADDEASRRPTIRSPDSDPG